MNDAILCLATNRPSPSATAAAEQSRHSAESKSFSGGVSGVYRSKAGVITGAGLVITTQDGGGKETT